MNAEPFFVAQDAEPLAPLGVCSECGRHEEPMIAVFWAQDADGRALCPECSGESASEGYAFVIYCTRRDRAEGLETLLGPYSATEAARALVHLSKMENVQSARIAQRPEWF